jgi:hypothetical protein
MTAGRAILILRRRIFPAQGTQVTVSPPPSELMKDADGSPRSTHRAACEPAVSLSRAPDTHRLASKVGIINARNARYYRARGK